MNAVTEMSLLNFTDNAANKVRELIVEEGNAELKLRVFVTGGGCSGFQYGFTFDEVQNEDDTVMQKNGVTLLIDPMSYQYLVGAEIDYSEGLEGAQFVINNPNASSTCSTSGWGCWTRTCSACPGWPRANWRWAAAATSITSSARSTGRACRATSRCCR